MNGMISMAGKLVKMDISILEKTIGVIPRVARLNGMDPPARNISWSIICSENKTDQIKESTVRLSPIWMCVATILHANTLTGRHIMEVDDFIHWDCDMSQVSMRRFSEGDIYNLNPRCASTYLQIKLPYPLEPMQDQYQIQVWNRAVERVTAFLLSPLSSAGVEAILQHFPIDFRCDTYQEHSSGQWPYSHHNNGMHQFSSILL